MFANVESGSIDNASLNLDAARYVGSRQSPQQLQKKNSLGKMEIFTQVNMQAIVGLGVESSQPIQLKFTVVPTMNPFESESNWKVLIDRRATGRERSAIMHAAKNLQRIFDLIDSHRTGVFTSFRSAQARKRGWRAAA